MATADFADRGYWRMCQIAKLDAKEGDKEAAKLIKEVEMDAVTDFVGLLVNQAYGGDEEKIARDLPKIALLEPDVKLTYEEAHHLLMLVWKLAKGCFGGDIKNLLMSARVCHIGG